MKTIDDQLGVAYSLRKHIEGELGIESILHYNGISLPEKLPFVMVRSVLSPHEYLSKARETVKTDFNFEISLYADSSFNLYRYQDSLRRLLLFSDVPYFDGDGNAFERTSFEVAVRNENHITAAALSDKTSTHRVFFEITVEGTYYKNRK